MDSYKEIFKLKTDQELIKIVYEDTLDYKLEAVQLAKDILLERGITQDIPKETKPANVDTWNDKANYFLALGKAEDAIICYDNALRVNPKDATALYNKGCILSDTGKHELAIECYEKNLEINPKDADAWNNKGLSFKELGKHEEAIKCFDKTLEINPVDPDALNNKALSLSALGREGEANNVLNRVREIQQPEKLVNEPCEETTANNEVGLEKKGKEPGFKRICPEEDEHLELNFCDKCGSKVHPDSVFCSKCGVKLRRTAKTNGEIPKMQEFLNKAIINTGNDWIVWKDKGNSFYAEGKEQEAIKCYDKVIEMNPGYADAWYNKALSLFTLGKQEEAIKCFDQVININPKDADAWHNKGNSLEALGMQEKAIECFSHAETIKKRLCYSQFVNILYKILLRSK